MSEVFEKKSKSKYKNKKVIVDGVVFASQKEYKRYKELIVSENLGIISNLRRQVSYELIPAQYYLQTRISDKTGRKIKPVKKLIERKCCYIADFVYTDVKTNQEVIEDTKGRQTKDYIIKRKLMLFRFKKVIHEV